jgi:hypothetical protein
MPEEKKPRKMRLLRSFHRGQDVFDVVHQIDDELRAMQVVAHTLAQFQPDTARRILRWVSDAYAPETVPVRDEVSGPPETRSIDESLALARQRLAATE